MEDFEAALPTQTERRQTSSRRTSISIQQKTASLFKTAVTRGIPILLLACLLWNVVSSKNETVLLQELAEAVNKTIAKKLA